MPNLVYCSLIMEGKAEAIAQVKTDISGLDEDNHIRPIDFNKIIPMPPELNISHCETVKKLTYAKYIQKSVDKHFEIFLRAEGSHSYQSKLLLAERYFENYQKYEAMTWYDWCNIHWGTKWNALYDEFQEQNKDPHVIHFITADHPSVPIMNALACKYPEVSFSLEYFNESDNEDITTLKFIIGEP